MTAEMIAGWESVLSDIPIEAIEAAVTRCLCERVYPTLPAPGEIRGLAVKWLSGESIAPDQAFDLLMKTVRQIGYSIAPDCIRAKDRLGPSIWLVVERLGGWQACCDITSGTRETFRAQFRDAWNRLVVQVDTRLRLPNGVAPKYVQPHELVENFAAAMGLPESPKPTMKETEVVRVSPGRFRVSVPSTDSSPRNDEETLALRIAMDAARKKVLGNCNTDT